MADSTLKITFGDLKSEVAYFLDYGRTYASLTADEQDDVLRVIREGLRQFYFPPPLPSEDASHDWTFLWSQIRLTLVDATDTYALPDSAAGQIGEGVLGIAGSPRIPVISFIELQQLRWAKAATGPPKYMSVIPASTDATGALAATAPHFQVVVYPTPTATEAGKYIRLPFRVAPDALSADADIPFAGDRYGHVILASCLAAADLMINDRKAERWDTFMERLAAAVKLDRQTVTRTTETTFPTDAGTLGADTKFEELRREIGAYLKYGWNPNTWTYEQNKIVETILRDGERLFYYPPPIPPALTGHQWSFLKPIGLLTTVLPFSDDHVDINNGETNVEKDGVTQFPTWAGDSGVEIVINGTAYPIASRTDGNTLELKSAWPNASISNSDYLLQKNAYQLPTDFAGIDGKLTFQENEGWDPIPIVGEGKIRELSQRQSSNGRPQIAAVRPVTSDGTARQLWELVLWPPPDGIYHFFYKYFASQAVLAAATPYMLGNPQHGNTLVAACLAAAESKMSGRGDKWSTFLDLLAGSISYDRRMEPEWFGSMSDGSVTKSPGRRSNHHVTYSGIIWGD